jgi:hypothetical protein
MAKAAELDEERRRILALESFEGFLSYNLFEAMLGTPQRLPS